ncbi:MAG: glycosyltransferase 2 family protein [Bacteroidales bacterium]|nr:glycosyltransferase 2 family protein [Bacteroidales bacterium]MDN5329915.1 glycosyltransferase 2 family protein [Bacteroidales bacterium]
MNKTLRNVLRLVFFLSIGIFFIYLFLHNLSPQQRQEILRAIGRANYLWIIISMIVGILSHASRARRWTILMEPLGHKPKYNNVFLAVFIGYFANLALPRLGEISRCGVLARYEKIPFNQSFGTVISERALDMLVFILLFFINLALQFHLISHYVDVHIYTPLYIKAEEAGHAGLLKWLIVGGIIGTLILIYVFRRRFYHLKTVQKIKEMGKGLWDGIWSIRYLDKPFEFIFHTIFIWVAYFLMAWIVFLSLEETAKLGFNAGLAVLVFGSIGIILVQGGIGVYPAIVAETLVLYGIASPTGYAMGWLLWTSQTLTIIIMGAAALLILPLINHKSYGFRIFSSQKDF